jgi:2-oxoisovalerate dehydrogenase E1 component alpha subunit
MTTVAEFKIEFIQYLNQDGDIVQPLPEFAHDLNLLVTLYQHMLKTRLIDAKAVALQRTGQMGTYPSSLGQEAVSVGIGQAMAKEDIFCPYYRDQGAMLIRGIKIEELLAGWGGDERGNAFQGPKQDFPVAIPVASQCLHATGCAYAVKYRHEQRAVLTSVGDGGTSKGDFYEALNLAGVWNLPVVFIINNNQWAISVPLAAQTHTQTLAQKAIAGGFEGLQVDGNDIIAVYFAVDQALKKARSGKGPTLIEAVTYRLCDHTTADDAKRYVDAGCLASAWKLEPLKRLYNYLVKQNAWSKDQDELLSNKLSQEIEAAVATYLNMPPQPITAIMDYHYDTWPSNLQEQREELGALSHA